MSERKSDEVSVGGLATGAHRAWVGETGGHPVRAGSVIRDSQRNWLPRPQPVNSRHAAITRSLYSWSSYKSWSDKVRSSWDKDKDGK